MSACLADVAVFSWTAQAQTAVKKSFNIPAGSLSKALAEFGKQSGLQVSYPSELTAGKSSAGASGSMTSAEALAAILGGSGLAYSFANGSTVSISAQSDAGATIDGAIALDTINVSAANPREAAADEPYETAGSNAYVSAEQINRVPPTSTGDMFKSTPGVIVAGNRNGVAMDVNIRGLQGMNRVNTMVDGAMQQSSSYRGYTGHDSRVFVDPELIAGIDIEKGPTSGAGGAGVVGGTVNMRTINARDIVPEGQSTGVRIRMGLGSNSLDVDDVLPPTPGTPTRTDGPDFLSLENRVGSVAVGYVSENFDLLIAGAHRKSGNYRAGTNGPYYSDVVGNLGDVYNMPMSLFGPGQEVFNTSQDTYSKLIKTKLSYEEHTLELAFNRYDSEFGEVYPDSVTGGYVQYGDAQKYQTELSTVLADTYTARYAYSPDNPFVALRANFWLTDVDNVWTAYSLRNQVKIWGADASNTSRLETALGNFSANYGAQYFIEKANSSRFPAGGDSTSNPNGERSMKSGFGSVSYEPTAWLKLEAGARYDSYEATPETQTQYVVPHEGDNVSPTLSVIVTPFDGIQLFGKYAQGWRPPSVRELFINTSNVRANPFLRPEQAENYEAGVNVLRRSVFTANDKLRLKFAYFDNNYVDYIVRMQDASLGVTHRTWGNIDAAKFKGIEFSGSYDMGRAFAEFAQTYYTDAQYCYLNQPCSRVTGGLNYQSAYVPPEYTASLTLGTRWLDNDALVLGTRLTYAGDRAMGYGPGATGTTAVWEPYLIVDLFGSYEIDEHLRVDTSIENLFDRYYLDAISAATVPSPGRTLRSSLTFKF